MERIKNEVEGLEAKCFSKDLDNAGLTLLAQQIKEMIYLHRHRNNVFENNSEQQKNIEEHFKAAANRLESLLNDVVLPKIEFRNSRTNKKEPENEFSYIEKKEQQQSFIANEYALAYIFDLYAKGKQVPQNPIEGGLAAKEIERIGKEVYNFPKEPDSFYRAVKTVKGKYDINKKEDLENISKRWCEAVRFLSKDWNTVSEYLKDKRLITE